MTNDTIELFGRPCGSHQNPLMVAELSGNHSGRLDNALRMIDAAAEAGADAVKIQTYTADTLTIEHNSPEFLIQEGLWQNRTLHELYREAHTPWEWHEQLFAHARKRGITLFSSPFDPSAVDLLESLKCPAYKIASFELVDTGLIDYAASTGKPLILSTGMATLDEIDRAVAVVQRHPGTPCILLHCTSGYPTPLDEADLRTIPMLQQRYGLPIGLSDHTTGIAAPVAAVALGAAFVEKHFTLDRQEKAVDAAFSIEPMEFRQMAETCRQAHRALGSVRTQPSPTEIPQRRFRRSLYVVADIAAGETFSSENVRSIRPGLGLPPHYLTDILGRRASRNIHRGEALDWSMLADAPDTTRQPDNEA